VAATAQTVTLDGLISKVHIKTPPASTALYVRGSGTAAVAADLNYVVFPSPDEGTCVPVVSTNGTTTAFSIISTSGTPLVSVLPCDCDD
jgi:hypothetical protein